MALKWKKGESDNGEMSFLEHLEELRWHIIRSLLAIFVFMIIAFLFKNVLFDKVILAPRRPDFITNRLLCLLGHATIFGHTFNNDAMCINRNPANLININLAGQMMTHFKVAIIAGLILAFPFVIREFWNFFRPALHSNEAKYARGAVLASSLLFFIGVVFGYFALAPISVHFLSTYVISTDIVNQINIKSYIGTVSSLCLATGIIFELPIIAYFLTKIGVITPAFMRKYRKHAIVLIFIVAAVITPPDVFSQTLVAIPLMALYEVSILVSVRVVKEKEKKHSELMGDKNPAA